MDTPADSGVEQAQMPIKGGNRHAASFVAVVSAVIALGAAITSVLQLQVAASQNRSAERSELASIVQNLVQLNQAPGSGVSVQGDSAQSVFLTAQMADAEQAAALAREGGATPTEYFEIAYAFANQFDWSDALTMERQAIVEASAEPRIKADALREEALIYFSVGGSNNVGKAQEDLALAAGAFSGQALQSATFITYNDVYTDLFAARIAASQSCSLAERYFLRGRRLIKKNGPALDQFNGDLSQLVVLDTSALKSCASGGGLLAPSPVPPQPVTVPPQPVTVPPPVTNDGH
jgi:hypothetical protein